MIKKKHKTTHRSHEFIQSFQLDGLCEALRLLVSNGIDPGMEARKFLQTLHSDFAKSWSGRFFDIIPEPDEATAGADLYVIAELLRCSYLAFLTPEEREERQAFGFHAYTRSS